MIFFISSYFLVISLFSFLILLISIVSLCPLVSVAKGLSVLLIFSKNQLLVLLLKCSFCVYLVDFSPEFDYLLSSTLLGCICFLWF